LTIRKETLPITRRFGERGGAKFLPEVLCSGKREVIVRSVVPLNPLLRQAAGTLSVILGQCSAIRKRKIRLNKVESSVQFDKLEKIESYEKCVLKK
jgi:hypothetical protein